MERLLLDLQHPLWVGPCVLPEDVQGTDQGATSNVVMGSTLLGQKTTPALRGAARSTGPPLPTLRQPSKSQNSKPKIPQTSLYPPPRKGHSTTVPVVITPQASSDGDDQPALLPPKIVYTEPYYT